MRKKTPNLQHQNLREQKKRQIYNIKIYVRKKTPNLQHQNLREQKKRQIYNIKIYVRKKKRQIYNIKIYVRKKKTAKFTTSKFTWGKKTPNLKHQNLRGKKNEKFTTSLTTSRTTLDVCQNIDRGRCLNQIISVIYNRLCYNSYILWLYKWWYNWYNHSQSARYPAKHDKLLAGERR